MATAIIANTWGDSSTYVATMSPAVITASETFPISFPPGYYMLNMYIVATGIVSTTCTVACRPFLNQAQTIVPHATTHDFSIVGTDTTGAPTGKIVTLANTNYRTIASMCNSGCTAPSWTFNILYGVQVQYTAAGSPAGSLVLTLVATRV
jgi:hypothetical protein